MSRPPDAPLGEDLEEALATASKEELAQAEQWLLVRGQRPTLAALASAIVQGRNRVLSAPVKAARAKAWQERKDAFYGALRADEQRLGHRVASKTRVAPGDRGPSALTAPRATLLGQPPAPTGAFAPASSHLPARATRHASAPPSRRLLT